MKIVHVETVLSCGSYAGPAHWAATKATILEAVRKCDWPPGSGKFTINPVRKVMVSRPCCDDAP